ncbi:serine acetyltransferase [Vibrio cholerae]|uniref:serine O-acetyltransferase n=1 Tax=Vibrio cholerae TaxID=666 RepID=UPI000BA946BD|nr:DapH/DapD/GlmU-related protein [Vibrio cholerae]MBU5690547.1 serine acetyltransferase [Vibrio cholerae]MCD6670084.1 serine acetyltransferase [Vibrio cholerae]PAS04604.1 serine acetyltransferase [Vibrio cholerae]TQQ68385.1 serine acetyltransferase [Vibrio cholerae]BCN19204.1 putative acetyltransferase [Vibrio cholerae]
MKQLILSDLNNYCALRGIDYTSLNRIRLWAIIFSPRILPVVFVRLTTSNIPIINRLFSLLNVLLFGIEVNSQCQIGRGFFLPHTHGIVIGAISIGDNCTIYQGVTLGAKILDFSNSSATRPQIGNNVIIGAGAKVLGGINIGDNVIIGANTVVTKSIPSGAKVIGAKLEFIEANDDK